MMAAPGVALADSGWGNVECGQDPAACDLDAGRRGGAGSGADSGVATGGGGSSGGWSLADCRFELAGSSAYGEYEGRMGTWYFVYCPGVADPQFPIFFPDGGGGPPVPSLAEVAQIARSRLALPTPRIGSSPSGDQLVGLSTWLWLDPAGWGSRTATASVPGVSVTATATPEQVTWSMGDGAAVTCTGPGTPYGAGTDPSSASPECGYTYPRSSAGQPGGLFTVTATVRWSVSWSGAGQSGVFPALTTTASTDFRVAESQAVVIAGRGG